MRRLRSYQPLRRMLLALGLTGLLVGLGQMALAQDETLSTPPASPMHPTFPLLDQDGRSVLDSRGPVSPMRTCSACHDTEFIAGYSFHADVGLNDFSAPGPITGERSWDNSPGPFGRWDPILYRYLSPTGDSRIDLTTPEWVQQFGARHVGGGPAVYSRDGRLLTKLPASAASVETSAHDPAGGSLVPWDWSESGVVEMNCFLCHTPDANNQARVTAVQAGQFAWAGTATLLGTGVVTRVNGEWRWNRDAFDANDHLLPQYVTVQDPTSANCGYCHGVAHTDPATPLVLDGYTLGDASSLTTGQIVSPQKISQSGLNLRDKAGLARSWDVHAERVLDCTNCHYALNNPVYYQASPDTQPAHLTFDPRRIDLGEYLLRPLHQFAKGESTHNNLATELDNSLRRCESCHDAGAGHDWLPYWERHTAALSCESCHVPRLYAPALQSVDWTVLRPDSTPVLAYRGLEGDQIDAETLIIGYEPVLLPRLEADGRSPLAPFNLVTAWYWVYGEPLRPVPLRDLEAAWLDGGDYRSDLLALFDADGDGRLDSDELVIDNEAKETAVAQELADLGLDNPRITGEVLPYGIHHNVTQGQWVTRECRACHTAGSRVTQPFPLAGRTPGGVTPTLPQGSPVTWTGAIEVDESGALYFQPLVDAAGLYLLGHSAVELIDWAGILIFLSVLVAVVAHGGLRVVATHRQAVRQTAATSRQVYMYDLYERLWHWLQTAVILLLIFTGLIIHEPDKFSLFSFGYVVQVHNVLAAILVVNAALALFYHLASGEIRQFLPRPRGFFDQAFEQARYYLVGIFRGEPHPFARTRQQKLNPLQQITYVAILNVLLPLQVITGILMWGAQRWPEIAGRLGGLLFLAPLHTLIAWLFAAFVVMHVYLTTTGSMPLANIKAMMLGWDEVEEHQ